ncbi:shTK domain protein [Teladorsagia circumcincta]|uniref:ShTK domain protein n=1 Tax=Teladorsagia circumcincta TaxID=45464 RepID=A0A2G9UPM7_TELCI|nr:shTK domain protein [Teladorsagia circumcincta]
MMIPNRGPKSFSLIFPKNPSIARGTKSSKGLKKMFLYVVCVLVLLNTFIQETNGQCRDASPGECRSMLHHCHHADAAMMAYMREKCPATCGFCR